MSIEVLEMPATHSQLGTVGRPRKKEKTRTLRVYGSQATAIQQVAGALKIDVADLVEDSLNALLLAKAPEVDAVMAAIREGATPQQAAKKRTAR